MAAPKLSTVVAPVAPPAPAPAPVPQPTLPKIQQATVDTVPLTSATQLADAPKLKAYATAGRSYNPPKPPPPPAVPAKQPAAPTVAAASTPSPPSTAKPAAGTDSRNLLVVNAFEVESHLTDSEIPAAEIHGRFEVTDSPSLPNGPTNGGSSNTVGMAGSGVADSGNGAGKGHAGSAKASGAGTGGINGKGAGGGTANIASSGSGHGAGIGTGAGEGAGRGSGSGPGNGAGSGAGGNGASPFGGMTIVGGSAGDGGALRSAPTTATVDPHDPRPGYGLTIVSSGNSGGAVRDLGVFADGPVYTVYIDVTRLGIRSRWSLQYSAAREIRIAHPGVALAAPLPQEERLPQLPPAAVTANVGRVVVVQAILKADGKLEALHVVESPDQRLNEGVIASLARWYFEPAAMGTEKVPVKVLLGIPISATMADNGVSQQADQHNSAAAGSRSTVQ